MASGTATQSGVHGELPPAKPGNPLFCHQEFLEKMEENRANTVGRRAALLMQRLLVNLNRQYYKPTQGENRGWRRSPLGGNHGSHYYAWWAPRGAAPLKATEDFEGAPEGAIFLRDIRHHDDHRLLKPHSPDDYLLVEAKELHSADFLPEPWTQNQARFAAARQKIRVLKGFPGSGKTTALWHAAEMAGKDQILYLTYSAELANLASEHFDRFAPGQKKFRVETFAQLVRQIVGSDAPYQPVGQTRAAFIKAVSGFSASILGPWLNEKGALYEEMHAHLIGAALPVVCGRFQPVPDRRISSREYRDLRQRSINRTAAESVVEVADMLRKRIPAPLEQTFFPELDLAWKAVQKILADGAPEFAAFDCLALDEAQDLTPIECQVVVELATKLKRPVVLVAGDEAQTVRPTDFEWGWFQDMLHHRMGQPMETKLQINLRSPQRIAALVNRVWDLYGAIAKHERPGGSGLAEIDANAGDQIIYCIGSAGPELDELLTTLTEREGLAVIVVGDEVPSYVPERLRDRILTTFEAKGLDFQSVCILDGGKAVDRISMSRGYGRGVEVEGLTKRLAIDQLRVALSRPAERLYWLEVNPSEPARHAAEAMLKFGDRVYPLVPAGLMKCLEEEALDPEERVRLCESDARQLMDTRPVLAWSRAQQAVALLGEKGGKLSVTDPAARKSAYLTLCQVSVHLALGHVHLPRELGQMDLFLEGAQAADQASRPGLSTAIMSVGTCIRHHSTMNDAAIRILARSLVAFEKDLEEWLVRELQPRSAEWILALEKDMEKMPSLVYDTLPVLYRLFRPAEAAERIGQLRDEAIQQHLLLRQYDMAQALLHETESPDPKLIAACHEGMGQLTKAADEFLAAGSPADALRCYRKVPDFDKTLELLADLPDHPARQSLEWVRQMRDLAAQRPAEFGKQVLPEEKKLLEQVLESSLGTARKKPAPRVKKAAGAPKKKAAAPKKKKEPLF
ncbi:MAG TPA: hypothetical protein VG456_07990 [Candidatus Sulfopaludibacter sp.]|jgi:hypothetical protein|nr:hypothetical protein [Candidatus Sulfopaludibacter sp.]